MKGSRSWRGFLPLSQLIGLDMVNGQLSSAGAWVHRKAANDTRASGSRVPWVLEAVELPSPAITPTQAPSNLIPSVRTTERGVVPYRKQLATYIPSGPGRPFTPNSVIHAMSKDEIFGE